MLEVKKLSVTLSKREILSDLSFSLKAGSFTALIGKNGSGKSTLLRTLGGCPYTGEIRLDGCPLRTLPPRERARRVAILPQVLAAPHMRVEELVTLGREPHRSPLARPNEEDLTAVRRAMEETDTLPLRNRYLDEISGGERQRAYLAMILAQDTPLCLLDEPTTYLDLSVCARFLELLSRIRAERGKTLLVAMHDLNAALRYADHILLLDGGKIAFFGTAEECLSTDVIERTFSVRRIAADKEILFVG